MQFHGLELDKFQQDAIALIDKEQSVIVSAPTGSGKTLIADYLIERELSNNSRVIYTAPIKALSNQKFKDFTNSYGQERIGLITGDLVINPDAQILIMTTEVYRNMAIIKDPILSPVSYVIMDEIHYLGDFERGYVWEESIIFSPDHVRFLFLSATIPNSQELAGWVEHTKHHRVRVVVHEHRPVPLKIAFYDAELGICDMKAVKDQRELDKYPRYEDAHHRRRFFRQARPPKAKPEMLVADLRNKNLLPCIYFVFSRAKTQEYAINLAKSASFIGGSELEKMREFVAGKYSGFSSEVKSLRSTQALRECLLRGVAFHHAGILPDLKNLVEELFGQGLVKVLFATETFAVGINMPAKAVCFDSLRKYTDTGFRYLNSKEFFQISGRAGRRGIDKEGLSVSVVNRDFDDLKRIEQFTRKDDLPINSQFRISPNTVLNMVNLHTPDEIERILRMNFYTFQQLKGKKEESRVLSSISSRYSKLVKMLSKLDYIRQGRLTELGLFTTHIFSSEIEISQLFYGDEFGMEEYEILLVLGALEYEEKKEVRFYKTYPSKKVDKLERKIMQHPVLGKGEWMRHLEHLSAIIRPCYDGKSFIDILKNTSMLEGDIIRIYMRILDKLQQIEHASTDHKKKQMLNNCKDIIKNCLKGIHLF